jgi:hypothetical protein
LVVIKWIKVARMVMGRRELEEGTIDGTTRAFIMEGIGQVRIKEAFKAFILSREVYFFIRMVED